MFSAIYWNPKREIFTLFNIPIVWYSLFFAIGFFLGFYLFFFILRHFLMCFCRLSKKDILDEDGLIKKIIKIEKTKNKEALIENIYSKYKKNKDKKNIFKRCTGYILKGFNKNRTYVEDRLNKRWNRKSESASIEKKYFSNVLIKKRKNSEKNIKIETNEEKRNFINFLNNLGSGIVFFKGNHPLERFLNRTQFVTNFIQKANNYIFEVLFFKERKKRKILLESFFSKIIFSSKEKAKIISDKIFFYMIISTFLGARIGHFIFYENFSEYIKNPLSILKTWQGGLSSHGAAIAIIFFLFIFCLKTKKKYNISISTLLDLVAVPVALASGFIRIGNFFNQEILGKQSSLFFAVIFGSPMDGSFPFARHPVQIYEAIFYFFVFFVLFYLAVKTKILKYPGKLVGVFLISIFSFRFFIEFFKETQSFFIGDNSFLLMGQYLSIPFVVLGIYIFFKKKVIS